MRRMLADHTMTGVVVVSTPEELPVAEAAETIEVLAAERLADLASVVANRVLPDLAVPTALIEREPAGPRRDAALLHADVWKSQRPRLAALRADHSFPLLFGIRTPGEVASLLADRWGFP